MVNPPSNTVDPTDVNLAPSLHAQYQLSTTDQITILEVELFNLKAHHKPGFFPVICTHAQNAQNLDIGDEEQTCSKATYPPSHSNPVLGLPEPTQADSTAM